MNPQVIYNKYLNKEYTVNDFLYHMRRNPMLKEHISTVNSAEDIISILKNRRIIWEQQAPTNSDPYDAFKAFAAHTKKVKEDYENTTDDADVDDVEDRGTEVKEGGYHFKDDDDDNDDEKDYDKRKTKDYRNYKFYTVNKVKKKIIGGWWYENDAKDDKKEIVDNGNDKNNYGVYSRLALERMGLNPKDDKNWGTDRDRNDDGQLEGKSDAGEKSDSYPEWGNEGQNDYDKYQFQSGETYKENIHEEAKAIETKPQADTYKGDANLGNVTKGSNKKKITADQVNYYEFTKGWKYEANIPLHGNITVEDANKAKEKAIRNLIKDPAYYSNLFAKQGMATHGVKPGTIGSQTKFGDVQTPVDKKNGMVPVKGAKAGASAGGSSKPMKTTEKMRSLKEALTKEIKKMIREDVGFNGNLQAMQQMTKKKPEELAKQVLDGFAQMTPMRKQFAGKVLGKAIADGNTDQTVADAFHKISDDINIKKENDVEERKSPLSGDEERTAKHIKPALSNMEKEYGKDKGKKIFYATVRKRTDEGLDPKTLDYLKMLAQKVIQGKEGLERMSDKNKKDLGNFLKLGVKHGANDKNIPLALKMVHQSLGHGANDIYKLTKNEGNDEEEYEHIAQEYGTPEIEQILQKHDLLGFGVPGEAMNAILTDRNWDKSFEIDDTNDIQKLKNWRTSIVKRKNEGDMEDSSTETDSDGDDSSVYEKNMSLSKAHPEKGKMHKLLGVKPGETVKGKYKDGRSLYNALMGRLHDHGKVTKMLAYAANINKEDDVFDAALHHAKDANPENKKEDKLPGGKGDDRPDSDFDPEQLAKGQKEEMEHTDDPEVAKEIAKDHLSEDPQYYSHLHTESKNVK